MPNSWLVIRVVHPPLPEFPPDWYQGLSEHFSSGRDCWSWQDWWSWRAVGLDILRSHHLRPASRSARASPRPCTAARHSGCTKEKRWTADCFVVGGEGETDWTADVSGRGRDDGTARARGSGWSDGWVKESGLLGGWERAREGATGWIQPSNKIFRSSNDQHFII